MTIVVINYNVEVRVIQFGPLQRNVYDLSLFLFILWKEG